MLQLLDVRLPPLPPPYLYLTSNSPDPLMQLTVLHTYRHLIRGLPRFPSKSRDKLLLEVKSEFRLNRSLATEPDLSNRIAEARAGVDQLRQYSFQGANWSVSTNQNPMPKSSE